MNNFKITNEFYKDAIHFAKIQAVKLKLSSNVDCVDIVHEALCNEIISETNWKSLIIDAIMAAKQLNYKFNVNQIHTKQFIQERYCRKCDESYPEQYFVSGFNKKRGCLQFRTICNRCHNKSEKTREQNKKDLKTWYNRNAEKQKEAVAIYRATHKDVTKKERMKRFAKKQTEQLGDWYIKRLLTRYKKYKPEEITQQLIELKRQEVLTSRTKKNKYKQNYKINLK